MINEFIRVNGKNGQLFITIGKFISLQVQPWMAMMIGVFLIIAVFRVYEYISTGEWRNRNNPNLKRRKDSIGDPLLMIRQMINTKPKRFNDIFPEELKELAKRRVNVLKEKDPFKISKLFPAYALLNSSKSSFRKSNLANSTSSTPPLANKKSKKSQVVFHTPQPLNTSSIINEPSPLFLSPNNIGSDNDTIATISSNEIKELNNTNPNNNVNPQIKNNNNNNNNNNSGGSGDFNKLNYNATQFKINSSVGIGNVNNIPETYDDGNSNKKEDGVDEKVNKDELLPSPQSLRSTWNGASNINLSTAGGSSGGVTTLNELPFIEDYTDEEDEILDSASTLSGISKKSDVTNTTTTSSSTAGTTVTSSTSTSYSTMHNIGYNQKVTPSVSFGLVGLALSGGGIRSATFNLGLLQALSKHKLFKKIDYLSTVSGGGFIGSCLISLLSEGTYTTEWNNFPFHYGRGLKEGTPLTHLRNSANYLANGIFEFLLFPVLILRGIVLNLISIFPFVWALLLFERYVPVQFGEGYHVSLRIGWNLLIHIIIFPIISRPKVTIPVLVGFIFFYYGELSKYFSKISNIDLGISIILHLYLNFPMLFKKEGSKVWYDRSFGWLFIVLIAGAFVESLPLIEVVYTYYFGGSSSTSFRVYPLISLFALILADSLAFTLLTNPKLSPWKRLVFHIIVSVIGPILLILTYLELSVWLDSSSPLFGVGNGMCFFISLLSFFSLDINETSMHKYYRDRLSKAYMFSIKNGRFRPYGGEKISRLNRRSVAPYLLVNTTLNSVSNSDGLELPNSRGSDFFIFSQHYCGSESSGYRSTEQMERLDRRLDLATAVSISGAAVGTKMGTATIPTLVMSLGILNIRLGYWLPNPLGIFLSHPILGRVFYGGFACYHLVKEFGWTPMTSKDWCINLSDGGHIENLGAYELIKRRCKFIIISDSEADPDMTFPSMAQLMRLVRIDFGINIQINLDDIRRSPTTGYSKKHWTVGKIIYQKKKSGFSHDTQYSYHHGDGGDSGKGGVSSNNYGNNDASGKGGGVGGKGGNNSFENDPPSGEVGYILYIKSSLTGDEDEIIKEYQSQHPSFPHESTTDQFFTEAQFESYRSLGYHIGGSSLFGPKYNRLFDGENLQDFFEKIYLSCNGELPHGWKEKTDPVGTKYFVQEEHNKQTFMDPRINKKV
ncbi:hypothetical protein RB653_003749 [Dictyostelium firmibasis]|uniref:WW domain-containing protein n=1 Tax=Dictyostelium firmibasis TaxID=79012 RepID=A0AAN7YW33_9MYCE